MKLSEEPFARFDALMLDTRHRALAQRLFSWSIERSRDPDVGEHAKRAFLASTFGQSCAPRDASLEEIFLSTKFLMIFFLIDDAPSSVMDEFASQLAAEPPASPLDHHVEFLGYYRDLMSNLRDMGRDTRSLEHALQDIFLAMREEKRTIAHEWTFEKLLCIRKVVIGIPAFSECWRAIRKLSFTPAVQASASQSRVLDITCEIACIVNDIASFGRDEQMMLSDPEHADPNLALLRMRELGDRRLAVEEAIEWYNRKVNEFREVERSLLATVHGSDPSMRGYLDILRCAIVGDLATSKHLAPLRYEGSREALDRLVRLDMMCHDA